MSFGQSSITSVNPPVQHGTQLLLSWASSAPYGTIFQVYLNQQLVWSGTDGFGYGGFGQGGFGQSAGSYSWTSQPLSGGNWQWGVKPFDTAGNEGSPQTATVTVAAPPLPPAPFSDMTRMQYSYNSSTKQAVLEWNSSPG
jgi:hypothetical protein